MTRVAVFSDIHFGQMARTHFFTAPGEMIKGNSRGEVPLGEGLISLMKELMPEYIFIAGDLTSAAEPQEFYYCEKKILEIADQVGVNRDKIICCTGNHDVDWQISKLFNNTKGLFEHEEIVIECRKEKYQKIAASVANVCFEELKSPEGGPAPFSGIYESIDFVAFILNTSLNCGPNLKYSHGELTEVQLKWLEKQLDCYNQDERKKIVLMHHHPFNYPYPTLSEDISQIKEGADFVELAELKGIDLVIHGHRHHPKVKTVSTGGRSVVTYFCAGSLSVNAEHRSDGDIPNTVHFIDIDKEKDYFVLHNYSYSGTEGWYKTRNSNATPLDDTMMVGKVFTAEQCRKSLMQYKNTHDKPIKLEWEKLDEAIRFMTYVDAMKLLNEVFEKTHYIVGEFPKEVMLVKKGDI